MTAGNDNKTGVQIFPAEGGNIRIRPATRTDEDALADLAYRSYKDRFFNDAVTDQLGGSLKIFPDLIPDDENGTGQNRAFFASYWTEAMAKLEDKDGFCCYVAEFIADGSATGEIMGFVKGYGGALEQELFDLYAAENTRRKSSALTDDFNSKAAKKNPVDLPQAEKVAELGSLYIDPVCRKSGIGRLLTQRYAQEMRDKGYTAMTTRCYKENNSQRFFEKMGAELFDNCPIPQQFEKADGTRGDMTLPGETLFWNEQQLKALATEDVLSLQTGQKIGDALAQTDNRRAAQNNQRRNGR
ncbi:MAG: GNAT family N-acetyltransferase [Alphaproteobacteria bacterium]|nr:MAG: GNAT family N-acetyltransferase [Alphaproteobacteria bacterium]